MKKPKFKQMDNIYFEIFDEADVMEKFNNATIDKSCNQLVAENGYWFENGGEDYYPDLMRPWGGANMPTATFYNATEGQYQRTAVYIAAGQHPVSRPK